MEPRGRHLTVVPPSGIVSRVCGRESSGRVPPDLVFLDLVDLVCTLRGGRLGGAAAAPP
jgi:hypothetical protein